jgi:hypothetical protein
MALFLAHRTSTIHNPSTFAFIRVHSRFEISLQIIGAAGRVALPGLGGGMAQLFQLF